MACIRPILEYGDVVWGNCTKENSELLEKVQIEAARIITGLRVNSSKSILYSELGWETLQSRRDKHKLILSYKIIHGLAPQYLLDLIQPYFPTEHAYNLRSNGNFYSLPLCRTTSYYNSFIPSTIKLWNNLDAEIKDSSSLSIFKSKLKNQNIPKTYKHYSFGNRKENIILCQLRNKASNLNAHIFKDLNCGSESEGNVHFFFRVSKIYSTKSSTF